jgi:hypothetical protein
MQNRRVESYTPRAAKPRRSIPLLLLLLGLPGFVVLPGQLVAQTDAPETPPVHPEPAPPSARPSAPPSAPPTFQARLLEYRQSVFGVLPGVGALAGAGLDQWRSSPREWGQGGWGYGKRAASRFGQGAVQEAIVFGAGAWLRYETRYQRCQCSGFWRRSGHALSRSLVTRDASGRAAVNIPGLAGAYGGEAISMAWDPSHRLSGASDGVRYGSLPLGSIAVRNLLQEFWPKSK